MKSGNTTTSMARFPNGRKQEKRLQSAGSLKSVIGSVAREACRAQCNSRHSPAVEMFRLLPSTGFWWPVHAKQVDEAGGEQYRPPLDVKSCLTIMHAVMSALKVGSDEEERGYLLGDVQGNGQWEGRVWPWGVTREVLERALVGLVVAATEVLEEGEGVEMYEDVEGFVGGVKWRNGGSWFAKREVRGEVLVRVLRLVMVARQAWVERGKNSGGLEGRETLANTVDGLLNVVEGRIEMEEEAMERHFGNEEGWRFVKGEKLEDGWLW
ncbi:hypothetical protein B0T14DRAFT_607491 [Immersiella caudata]|uniref:Uncharacterized protein n=1 Tax=Immersiella caudata TaxID=314043 RepID=A0AA39U5I1_9PEZI|nr:hypothetical protein B0T14DRAFT_607491 [Immersiella caudata]